MDAAGWRCLLSSFRKESADLCEAMPMVARRICQEFVDSTGLDAFTACRLVALDKCPGVRPIGIGEVVRRIIGKAVLAAAGPQVPVSRYRCADYQRRAETSIGCTGVSDLCGDICDGQGSGVGKRSGAVGCYCQKPAACSIRCYDIWPLH